MFGNELGETTGKALIRAMQINKKLWYLNLEKNYI